MRTYALMDASCRHVICHRVTELTTIALVKLVNQFECSQASYDFPSRALQKDSYRLFYFAKNIQVMIKNICKNICNDKKYFTV